MNKNVNYDVLNKAFDLFIEWATDCDFGYDNIPEEYEKYKDEIERLGYNEGFKYIAIKEAGKLCGMKENVMTEMKWIPVSERLPNQFEFVLIQNYYGIMTVAELFCDKWYNFQGVELVPAVAWTYLPEPYEGETE